MSQGDFDLTMPASPGEHVKGWCSCGQECDCIIQVYSNGTRHAIATCPKCGKKNAKQQRLPATLEDLKHHLMSVHAVVTAMEKGVNQDEAIAMIERLAEQLAIETAR